MEKSTHKAPVVEVKLEPHTNSNNLSLVKIDGYQVVVRTDDWIDKQLGVYIQPDSIVDVTRPEFSFLAGRGDIKDTKLRIRACKFRGAISYGLLIPAPANTKLGDDLAEYFGVEHYEPELHLTMRDDNESGPPIHVPKYDIDSMRKYTSIFESGEPVWVSEKIHGANSRYLFMNDHMYCGSRTNWKKETATNLWWRVLKNVPQIEAFCKANQGKVLFGEAFGQVQNLKYGKNDVDFIAFDILDGNRWMNVNDFRNLCAEYNIPVVPTVAESFPFNFEELDKLSNGPSLITGAKHHREGVVCKPYAERWHPDIGRVILKLVGSDYLIGK